jgi:hypothetical protein
MVLWMFGFKWFYGCLALNGCIDVWFLMVLWMFSFKWFYGCLVLNGFTDDWL